MADFERKSAIFHTLRPALEHAANTELKRISGEMAELLMNSAIPSEGSMRTSWPRLRNSYCMNQSKYQIVFGTYGHGHAVIRLTNSTELHIHQTWWR